MQLKWTTCKFLFLCFCVTLLITSCNKRLKPLEYAHYVEDYKNGLHLFKYHSPFIFILQYKPLGYVALQELRQSNVSADLLSRETKSFSGMQYFTFRISSLDSTTDVLKVGTKSDSEYSKRQNYFDFYIQNDLKLIEGKDTLTCKLCHFVRNYGIAPYGDFVLGFDKSKFEKENDLEFVYDDKILKTGPVTFLVKQSSIKNIPQIKTD